jgi:hypothetical protein
LVDGDFQALPPLSDTTLDPHLATLDGTAGPAVRSVRRVTKAFVEAPAKAAAVSVVAEAEASSLAPPSVRHDSISVEDIPSGVATLPSGGASNDGAAMMVEQQVVRAATDFEEPEESTMLHHNDSPAATSPAATSATPPPTTPAAEATRASTLNLNSSTAVGNGAGVPTDSSTDVVVLGGSSEAETARGEDIGLRKGKGCKEGESDAINAGKGTGKSTKKKKQRTIKKKGGKILIRLRQLTAAGAEDPSALPAYTDVRSLLVDEFGVDEFMFQQAGAHS